LVFQVFSVGKVCGAFIAVLHFTVTVGSSTTKYV